MALSTALARRFRLRLGERGEAGGSPLLRNLAYLAGGQLATWVLTAVWTLVVPRSLGPAGMGQLTIAWSAVAIVSVLCELGTGVLITRNIARDHSRAPALLAGGILLRVVAIPIGWILVFAYIAATHFDTTQILVLILATAAMQVSLATGVIQAAFQGIERMEYLAYADVFSKTLMTIASIALIVTGHGVVAIMGLSLSISVVVFVFVLRWSRAHFVVTWQAARHELITLIRGGLPFWATSLFLTAYIWIDSVMLGMMTSEAVVGWYGTATKLFAALLFIPAVLSTAWFPRLVAAFGQGHEQFRVALARVLNWTVILSLPIAAGMIAISHPLIALIYGPQFRESAGILAILGLLLPFTYLNIVASQGLNASNRQLTWTKIMAVATVVNLATNLVLIPFFQARWADGAIGASISLLLTEILMSVAALFLMRRSLGAVTLTRLLNAVLAATLMGLIVWQLAPAGLVVQVVAGTVVFGGLALLLRIPSADEFAMAQSVARRLFNRAQTEEAVA